MIDEKKLIEDIWEIFNSTYNDARSFDKERAKLAKRILRDVQNVIENQPEICNWILCSERFPETGVDVLVSFRDCGNIVIAWYSEVNKQWKNLSTGNVIKAEVIVWQPLPENYKPPAEELI